MKELSLTLIGDGSSDKVLTFVTLWLLKDLYPPLTVNIRFADFRSQPKPPPKSDIQKQVELASELYPFDLLIYHRDAETNDTDAIEARKREVLDRISDRYKPSVVCVVPVRMMETWLLIDANAIKKASGNPNYRGAIQLPAAKKLEKEPDPKNKLHDLLRQASNLKGRRLDKLNVNKGVHLVAEYTELFAVLRNLEAFRVFEADLKAAVDAFLTRS